MKGTYTVAQAGLIIGCGRRQAYAAVHAGEIPSIRIGSRFYVPRAALHALLGLTTNADVPGAQTPGHVTATSLADGSPCRLQALPRPQEVVDSEQFSPPPAA